MIRFTLGLAIIVFTLIITVIQYLNNSELLFAKERGLAEVQMRLNDAKDLQTRVKNIRNISMPMGDDQKFTLERKLEIGAPGMELRFVGQPRYAGGNRALFRHTFRITGPATFEDSVKALERMNKLPGFALYKYCFACSNTPKGTPDNLKMVQIEGYLYVYNAKLL